MKRKQDKQPARGAPSQLSLANWPVSVRLAALFVIASLTGLIFGGLRVAGAVGAAGVYGQTTQLAVLSGQVTALAQALEDERDRAAGVAALATLSPAAVSGKANPQAVAQLSRAMTQAQASLTAARQTTDSAARLTVARASGVGPAFPSRVQAAAASVIAQARNLTGLRAMVTGQRPSAVIGDYSGALADLFALNDQVTSTNGDAQLTSEARVLGAMSRATDQASQQRAILDVALIESGPSDAGSGQPGAADHGSIGGPAALRAAGGLQALVIARSLQLTDVLSFQSTATTAEESAYLAVTASPQVAAALKISTVVTATGDPQAIERSSLRVTPATAPGVWYRDMSAMIGGMRTIESAAAGARVTRSELRQHQAAESALLNAVVTVVAVLLTLLATALVGRSLLHPLRRL